MNSEMESAATLKRRTAEERAQSAGADSHVVDMDGEEKKSLPSSPGGSDGGSPNGSVLGVTMLATIQSDHSKIHYSSVDKIKYVIIYTKPSVIVTEQQQLYVWSVC